MWLTDDPSELIYHRLVKRDAPGMPIGCGDLGIVLGGSRRVSMLQINGSRAFRKGWIEGDHVPSIFSYWRPKCIFIILLFDTLFSDGLK